jgi:hypothetical protein
MFARVQGTSFENTATTANVYSQSFSAPIGSGQCVVGYFQYDGTSNTLTSITDDKGNSYTVKDTTIDVSNNAVGHSFILGNISNGPITINFNFSTSHASIWGCIDEFSGVLARSDPSEAHSATTPTSVGAANTWTANTITPISNGDLVWSAVTATSVTEQWTAGVGWTQGTQSVGVSNGQTCTEYLVQNTAAGIAPTFHSATGTNVAIGGSMAILPPAPSAGNVGILGLASSEW